MNFTGGDTAILKWRMGEDVPGYPNGLRDMETPSTFGDPDSMTSIYYCKSGNCYNYDNGGVHYNSGVNNKAAYLMVDGGTFNLKTVSPLGWTKTLTIYYEAPDQPAGLRRGLLRSVLHAVSGLRQQSGNRWHLPGRLPGSARCHPHDQDKIRNPPRVTTPTRPPAQPEHPNI